jgi:DNA-binding HxlR family transcriptional regulator
MRREYRTMSQSQNIILKTLFKDHKHSVSSLQKTTKISPRILRKYLDTLKEEKLVAEEVDEQQWRKFNLTKMQAIAKSWKQRKNADNRPRIIYLTKKGKNQFLKHFFDDINKSLKDITNLLAELCSDPERLKEWDTLEENAALRNLDTAQYEGTGGFQRAVEEYKRKNALRSAPLDEACRNLHLLKCIRHHNSLRSDEFVTVIRGNEVLPPISSRYLEDIDFQARFFGLKSRV